MAPISMQESLICQVMRYPELYDVFSKEFKDAERKAHIWRGIGAALNMKDTICKTKWRSLKDRYVRERRALREKPGTSRYTCKKKWKYFTLMSFLEPIMSDRETLNGMRWSGRSQVQDDYHFFESDESIQDDGAPAAKAPGLEVVIGDGARDEKDPMFNSDVERNSLVTSTQSALTGIFCGPQAASDTLGRAALVSNNLLLDAETKRIVAQGHVVCTDDGHPLGPVTKFEEEPAEGVEPDAQAPTSVKRRRGRKKGAAAAKVAQLRGRGALEAAKDRADPAQRPESHVGRFLSSFVPLLELLDEESLFEFERSMVDLVSTSVKQFREKQRSAEPALKQ